MELEPEIGRADPKLGWRTRNWDGGPEIGRANLLVSRIMMFAIIDRKTPLRRCLRKEAHREVRPPKQKEPTSRFVTYSGFTGKKTAYSEGFKDEHEKGSADPKLGGRT